MKFTYILPAALAAIVGAQSTQNITQALSSNPDLSTLVQLLMGQTDLMKSLASAQNITVIAPNNNAFARFMNSSGAQASANPSMLTGTLSYHVLQGNISSDQITATPAFVPTLLTNPTFSNVTGGQRVEAVKMGNNVLFYGGLKMSSMVVKAVSHPFIHSFIYSLAPSSLSIYFQILVSSIYTGWAIYIFGWD